MITLRVDVVSGHYRVPGQVGQGQTASTYPIAPPSTVVGFLESLCGVESGTLVGDTQVAMGFVRRPQGHGILLRKDHSWASGGIKPTTGGKAENIRAALHETLFFISYRIAVRGPFVERIRAAMAGDVDRYGVLSLGESEDAVDWICEEDGRAEWLVPGSAFTLPVKAGRGYKTINPVFQNFDFIESDTPPEMAWEILLRRK